MSTAMKVFWLLSLVFFVGGCSSYRAVSFPRSDPKAANPVDEDSVAQAGDNVRVTLTSARVVEGHVVEITPEFLIIDPSTGTPENEMSPIGIGIDSVSGIEVMGRHLGNSVFMGAGVVFALGAVAITVVASSMRSGSFWGK